VYKHMALATAAALIATTASAQVAYGDLKLGPRTPPPASNWSSWNAVSNCEGLLEYRTKYEDRPLYAGGTEHELQIRNLTSSPIAATLTGTQDPTAVYAGGANRSVPLGQWEVEANNIQNMPLPPTTKLVAVACNRSLGASATQHVTYSATDGTVTRIAQQFAKTNDQGIVRLTQTVNYVAPSGYLLTRFNTQTASETYDVAYPTRALRFRVIPGERDYQLVAECLSGSMCIYGTKNGRPYTSASDYSHFDSPEAAQAAKLELQRLGGDRVAR
jgi:hypothetical protein